MAMTKVATLSELTAGKGKLVIVNDRRIAIFHDGTNVYATDDTCPHRGASLADGMCREGQVMCPWHAARFDLATGAHLCPPAQTGVRAFPVQIAGEDVQIDI